MAVAFPARVPRRLAAVLVSAAAALPISLLLVGSVQAAPTLTLPEAEAQLATLQTQSDAAVEAYDAGQIAATASYTAAAQARAAVTTQTTKLTALQAGIASFAVQSYEGDQLDSTDVMLSGGDPSTIVQKADALGQIAALHQTQLNAVTAQQLVLANARAAAAQKATAAAAAVTQLAAAKARIDGLVTQQTQLVNHLQAQVRAALLAKEAAERAAAEHAAQVAEARQAAANRAAAVQAAASRTSAATSTTRTTVTKTTTTKTTTTSAPPVVSSGGSTNAGLVALQAAENVQGDPYVYGAAGPSTFDCSGLVMWAFAHAGVSLPHSAAAQMGYGTPVSYSNLQPGDIVFYDEGGSIGHDGIYVGNGQMIDANHTGGWVGIRSLYPGYAGARRL